MTAPPVCAGSKRYRTESELLAAARKLGGTTLEELALRTQSVLPTAPIRDKGFIGRSVERALGLPESQRSTSPADFGELGIELKTLPVGVDGRPRESTFVCYVPLDRLSETEWKQSRVASKLSRVLFVPIESAPGLALAQRRVGSAFLWSPSVAQEQVLREDYTLILARVADGHIEALDARVGKALQLRPKAANGRVNVRFSDGEGLPLLTRPRGFYLRASFTADIVRQALRV